MKNIVCPWFEIMYLPLSKHIASYSVWPAVITPESLNRSGVLLTVKRITQRSIFESASGCLFHLRFGCARNYFDIEALSLVIGS